MATYQYIQVGLVLMEFLAFLCGIINFKKINNSFWKWFVYYLGFIVAGETVGLLLLYAFHNGTASRDVYNYVVIPVEFLFFCWLYYRYFISNPRLRIWPLAGAAIYAVSWLTDSFFVPGMMIWLFTFSYLVGVVVLLVLTILFFTRFMESKEILHYKNNMMFWISLGLLIFYIITSPYFALRSALYKDNRQIFWIYFYIQFGVNYLMYTLFGLSFVWAKTR
jgi:hypothetical protein